MQDFDEYLVAGEPGKRERAYGWATAIGLQDVDGLKVSKYLLDVAKRNIEGEISGVEARQIIDEYYETKLGCDEPEDAKEADRVSARIVSIINAPGFRISPEYYIGLHKRIFEGVFSHAGRIRDVELTKREWVLNGDSVEYELSCMIEKSLAYDFDKEREFKYKGLSEDAFIKHFASFISGIWQIHPFREGNTRVAALFAIKYLQSMRYDVTNDLFAEKSWFFRNALVRANYVNIKLNVDKTQIPLEEFFKVLIFGYDIELRNRYLRIGYEHGSQYAEAVGNMHRDDVGINVGIKSSDVGLNSLKSRLSCDPRFTETEMQVADAIFENNKITARDLSSIANVTVRQIERIIASLKDKVGLRREGARKNGRWVFGE